MRPVGKPLFSRYELRVLFNKKLVEMTDEMYGLTEDQILKTEMEEIVRYFKAKYDLTVPTLEKEKISTDSEDLDLDPNRYLRGYFEDFGPPPRIRGTKVEFHIPFVGDGLLFDYRPSSFSGPPTGDHTESNLVIGVEFRPEDAEFEKVKKEFDRELAKAEEYLAWQMADVSQYRETLVTKARALLDTRRKKIIVDREILVKIGKPIRRVNAPMTYLVPKARRKIEFPRQSVGDNSKIVEWSLDTQVYENILSILESMVQVMEYSPKAFSNLDEEDLRFHFLVQLNGQYEGTATAETFNFTGKTDIVIREEGKSIFVAECKFWNGPKSLTDTVDQILGYLAWRDTKAAIIVFNRNRGFSEVLRKIQETMKTHPNCDRQLQYASERGFRFEMHRSDDPEKKLLLTVLAFDIPNPLSTSS